MTDSDRFDPVIAQGATWSAAITWLDETGQAADLSGYGAKMQIRDGATGSLIRELTHEAGITLGSGEDNILIEIPATVTQALGNCVYDLFLTQGDWRGRVLAGIPVIEKSVTQWP